MTRLRYLGITLATILIVLLVPGDVLGKNIKSQGLGKGKPSPKEKPSPADEPAPSDDSMEPIDSSGRPLSVSHDVLGNAAVAYFIGNELKFGKRGSAGWETQSIGRQGDYSHGTIDLAIDPNGFPGIVFDASFSTGVQELRFGYFDGIGWNIETIDTRAGHASLVFDGNGVPHVSYSKGIDRYHSILCVAKKVNGQWDIEI